MIESPLPSAFVPSRSRRRAGPMDDRIDAPRLLELRAELGDAGLAAVLAILAADIEKTIAILRAGPDATGMDLQRLAHRLVGTLAQFGLSGHAERIRIHSRDEPAGSRVREAMAGILGEAMTVIVGEASRLTKGKQRRRSAASMTAKA